MNGNELDKEIEKFSEFEPFREAYLSKYIDSTSKDLVLQTSVDESGVSEDEKLKQAGARFDKLSNLNLNLVIRAPSRGVSRTAAEKSPILFGLQVGDYVFEWNETSLVVPVDFKQVQFEPLLLSPIQMETSWPGVFDEGGGYLKQGIEEAIQNKDYTMQISLQYELTEKKDKLLKKFINTVLQYNRNKKFNKRSCNNQTFLSDVMKSFGIKRPTKFFSSTIQQHIKSLKPSSDLKQKKMTSHHELDAIVKEAESESLAKEDIEFLIAKYFLFHVSSWEGEQEGGSSNKWECSRECQLCHLEKLLERRTSISST